MALTPLRDSVKTPVHTITAGTSSFQSKDRGGVEAEKALTYGLHKPLLSRLAYEERMYRIFRSSSQVRMPRGWTMFFFVAVCFVNVVFNVFYFLVKHYAVKFIVEHNAVEHAVFNRFQLRLLDIVGPVLIWGCHRLWVLRHQQLPVDIVFYLHLFLTLNIHAYKTTNAAGSAFTSTVISTEISTQTILPTANSDASSSKSHTSAIVGGVVGGVGGALLLAALVFLLFRRRRRDDFDGYFDPDRVGGGGTLAHIDLAGADNVEPYTYNPAGSGAIGPGSQGPSSSATGSDEMRQHGNVPAFLTGGIAGAGVSAAATHRLMSPPTVSAPSHYSQSASQYAPSSSEHYPDYSAYSGGYAQPGAGYAPDFRQPSPGPSLAMTGSSSGGGYGAAAGAGASIITLTWTICIVGSLSLVREISMLARVAINDCGDKCLSVRKMQAWGRVQ
ncbi:hypothetical protein POSPLADRAFT_1055216 [Postia placenta MAD-698-R-SB12]|uniref:Uncharacterized protein n=1 Tax=Postia placenta MAD-698-R-SB12 TaxID=670580 RepID=A0A1X6N3E5_9APHY|nr:hypothetical protein POSPLADRAFT_1055216 [Postia placenta MAD-698-R-SB12]OSX63149.1 hypothetical protein POSPLADRAFT_1055216 [Postia placenta MAD-698-R-SB12]